MPDDYIQMLIKKLQIKKSEEKDKMITRIRNKSWDDQRLEEALRNCNRQDLQRTKTLSFMVCVLENMLGVYVL